MAAGTPLRISPAKSRLRLSTRTSTGAGWCAAARCDKPGGMVMTAETCRSSYIRWACAGLVTVTRNSPPATIALTSCAAMGPWSRLTTATGSALVADAPRKTTKV